MENRFLGLEAEELVLVRHKALVSLFAHGRSVNVYFVDVDVVLTNVCIPNVKLV